MIILNLNGFEHYYEGIFEGIGELGIHISKSEKLIIIPITNIAIEVMK